MLPLEVATGLVEVPGGREVDMVSVNVCPFAAHWRGYDYMMGLPTAAHSSKLVTVVALLLCVRCQYAPKASTARTTTTVMMALVEVRMSFIVSLFMKPVYLP
jgi:hypothetical protein